MKTNAVRVVWLITFAALLYEYGIGVALGALLMYMGTHSRDYLTRS
jgi:hypothetical protein